MLDHIADQAISIAYVKVTILIVSGTERCSGDRCIEEPDSSHLTYSRRIGICHGDIIPVVVRRPPFRTASDPEHIKVPVAISMGNIKTSVEITFIGDPVLPRKRTHAIVFGCGNIPCLRLSGSGLVWSMRSPVISVV